VILSAMFAATILMADTTPAAAAAAATTVSPATVTAPSTKDAKADKPRLICKTEAVTGSLMPKKTCYTSDDLAQRRQEERANLEKIQNQLGLQSR
jgi:invasion protein IalB